MLRKSKRSLALLLTFMMLATLFAGVPMASAKSVNSVDRVIAIADDYNSTTAAAPVGSVITISEDPDLLNDFGNGQTFKVTLPDGVKWVDAQTTVTFNGVAGVQNTDWFKRTAQVIEIVTPAVAWPFGTAAKDVIQITPGIEVVSATGDITATIDAMDSAVSSGAVVFATVTSGKTTISVDSVKKIGKTGTGGVLEIRENAIGVIGVAAGNTLTLKLPSNFEWNGMAIANVALAGGFGAAGNAVTAVTGNGTRTLDITFTTVAGNTSRGIIYVTPQIKAAKEAAQGEVSVSISGKNAAGNDIADADIVIANYTDYGTASTIKEVKELKSGKFGQKTAKITIEENILGTLLQNRDVNIELPSWVKITGVNNFNVINGGAAFNATAAPVPTGKKSNIDITVAGTSTAKGKIELVLELSIEAGRSGDIEAKITGAGATEETLVVAKAIAPVGLTATSTNVKVGVQDQVAGDIVITENKKEAISRSTLISGAAANDGKLTLTLTEGVKFSAEPTVTVTQGNLEVDKNGIDLSADKTQLIIPIKSEGTNLTEITVSNVKVTLDRTIPEGAIYVKVGGSAIAENQKAALGFLAGTANPLPVADNSTNTVDRGEFDVATVAKAAFATVVTPAPGGANNAASFVIGESSYTLNGVTVTMDVAPYIKDDRTYLPIRYVGMVLGVDEKNILWDDSAKTATLIKGDKIVQVKIGSKQMLINGITINMDVAPEITNDRTMLPFRFIGQAFGAEFTWDDATKTVSVKM